MNASTSFPQLARCLMTPSAAKTTLHLLRRTAGASAYGRPSFIMAVGNKLVARKPCLKMGADQIVNKPGCIIMVVLGAWAMVRSAIGKDYYLRGVC
jgi:hypothetical protein